MLHPDAFRQSTAARLRDRGDRRFSERDSRPEMSKAPVPCVGCEAVVPSHDAILQAHGHLCLPCDASAQTADALRQESWDTQIGLIRRKRTSLLVREAPVT